MKNKKSIIQGAVFTFLSAFIIAELLQFAVFYFWTGGDFELSLMGLNILSPEKLTKVQTVIIISLPLFYVFSTIELAINLLKYQTVGRIRFTLLTFIILNTGYLIVNVFTGAFNIVMNIQGSNSWAVLCRNLELSETARLIFIFIVVVLLVNYLRSFNRIVTEYISYKK
ncbi:MAG: hypothetical protein ACEPO8_06285 [Rhodothermaceae bacterium]